MTTGLKLSKQIQDIHRMALERCQVAIAGLTHKLDEIQKSVDAAELQIKHANIALFEREQQFGIQSEWRGMTQRFILFHENVLSQLHQEQSKLELAIETMMLQLNQHHVQVKVQERYVDRVIRDVQASVQKMIQHESDEVWSRKFDSSSHGSDVSMFQTPMKAK